MSDCCPTQHKNKGFKKWIPFDLILYGSLAIILLSVLGSLIAPDLSYITEYAHAVLKLFKAMWWGIVMGVIFVGLMGHIPKSYFHAILGRGDTFGGVLRATVAGLFLDLCSHGIVMVGAKLYERGASLAQVMAFLIASPWNSLSLTFILIALVGLKWTLVFIAGSAVIAIISGCIYLALVKYKILPPNENTADIDIEFDMRADIKARLNRLQKIAKTQPLSNSFTNTVRFVYSSIRDGFSDVKMLIKWLLFGVVIAAAITAFIPQDVFAQWFGPSLLGLSLTLIATTLIEVCSEGSAPVASEIINKAGAPGNGFVFLMAGVSTDYTEIMIIKEFSKRWLIALSLPLVTVPQVILLGWIMNVAGG